MSDDDVDLSSKSPCAGDVGNDRGTHAIGTPIVRSSFGLDRHSHVVEQSRPRSDSHIGSFRSLLIAARRSFPIPIRCRNDWRLCTLYIRPEIRYPFLRDSRRVRSHSHTVVRHTERAAGMAFHVLKVGGHNLGRAVSANAPMALNASLGRAGA